MAISGETVRVYVVPGTGWGTVVSQCGRRTPRACPAAPHPWMTGPATFDKTVRFPPCSLHPHLLHVLVTPILFMGPSQRCAHGETDQTEARQVTKNDTPCERLMMERRRLLESECSANQGESPNGASHNAAQESHRTARGGTMQRQTRRESQPRRESQGESRSAAPAKTKVLVELQPTSKRGSAIQYETRGVQGE